MENEANKCLEKYNSSSKKISNSAREITIFLMKVLPIIKNEDLIAKNLILAGLNFTFYLSLLTGFIFTKPSIAQNILPNNDGTATIVTKDGQTFNINGGTLSRDGKNLFHSLQEFGLDANQIANFLSNPNIHNILTRINGGNPSIINGLIQVTGGNSNLYLMNPSGFIFGENSTLNVPASFTATTATGIGFNGGWFEAFGTNYHDLVGNPNAFKLAGTNAGVIINAGKLKLAKEQHLSLVGGQVINLGEIEAPGGKITIAAVPGTSLVRLSQEGQLLSLELELPRDNNGNILPVKVADLPTLLTNNPIKTGLSVNAAGEVTLNNSNTTIPNDPATTIVSGKLNVAGNLGGQIRISGKQVGLISANIDTDGLGGGGKVLIGGEYQGQGSFPNAESTYVSQDSVISADATKSGDGGQVIVWADRSTKFHGNISAKGGVNGGNGGLVETSGKINLDVSNAVVDSSSVNGQSGTWLLDPTDVNIISGGTGTLSAGIFDPPTNSNIDPNTIAAALNGGTNVEITTSSGTGGDGDITLTDSIFQRGGGSASLTFTGRRFNRFQGSPGSPPSIPPVPEATINLTSTGNLTFNINQVNPETNPPSTSIQNAIDAIGTVNGSTFIILGSGTFSGGITIDKSLTLRGNGANNTTISGNNIEQVVVVDDGTATNINVEIDALTIAGGKAGYNFNTNTLTRGGGVFNQEILTINNSTITNNNTEFFASGAGIANQGDLTINNSTITGNSAVSRGGGIYNQGNLTINNSTISGNTATNGAGISIRGIQSNLTTDITNSTIYNNTISNTTNTGGAGISIEGSVVSNVSTKIINSTITVNIRAIIINSISSHDRIANINSISSRGRARRNN